LVFCILPAPKIPKNQKKHLAIYQGFCYINLVNNPAVLRDKKIKERKEKS